MAQGMTIGGLAKAAGVNVETIRYYQRRGLIDEPRKPPGGQRRYPATTSAQLAFIRRAQQLGFTLAEIKELLRLTDPARRRDLRRIAETCHSRLALQARQLAAMAARLNALLKRSRRYRGGGSDPIIAALQGKQAGSR